MEGSTLLPVLNPIVEPGPSCTDEDVAPPSSLQQTDVHLLVVEKMPSSDVYQPSSNVDTTNIMSHSVWSIKWIDQKEGIACPGRNVS